MSFVFILYKILIVLNLFRQCCGELTYLFSVNSYSNKSKISYVGSDSNSKGFIFMDANLNYTAMMMNINPLNDTIISGKYTQSFGNKLSQFRIHQTNSIANPNNIFISFSNNAIKLHTNNFWGLIFIYTTPLLSAQTIIDARFGINTSEIFGIIKYGTGNHNLVYFVERNEVSNKTINPSLNGNYVQSKLYGSVLYVIFQKGIAIYSANQSLTQIKVIIFANITTSTIVSLAANSIYMAYCYDKNCFVCDASNSYIQIDSISKNKIITDIQLIPPYIIITTDDNFIEQYDMDIKISIHTIKTDVNGSGFKSVKNYRTALLYDKYLLYSQPFSYVYPRTYYFKFDDRQACSGLSCVCNATYILNTTFGKCVKSYTNLTIANITTPQANYTVNQTNSSIIYYNVPVAQNDTHNISNVTVVELQQIPIVDPLDEYIQVLGKSLAIATLKFNPKFLVSLVLFLDDLWFYQYHHNNYTKSAKLFMQKVSFMNELRLSAWILQFINFVNDNLVCNDKNELYMKYQTYGSSHTFNVYFLNSSEQVYKGYLIQNAIIFLILKFFSFLCFLLGNYSPFAYRIYKFLKRNTSLAVFIASIVQLNMIILTFNFSVQTLSLYRFDMTDTVNMIITIITFLCLILYSILYYPLLFTYKSQATKQLLVRSKYQLKGCFTQLLTLCFRNLFRSMMHGLLIQSYESQIISLIFLDFFFVVLIYIFRRNYQNKVLFSATFFYNAVFMAVDTFFFIQYKNPSLIASSTYDLIIFICICTLIFLSLLVSLAILLKEIYDFAKRYFKNLKDSKNEIKKIQQIIKVKTYLKKQKGNQKLTLINTILKPFNYESKTSTIIKKSKYGKNNLNKESIISQAEQNSPPQKQQIYNPISKFKQNSKIYKLNNDNEQQNLNKIKVKMLAGNKIKPQKSKYFTIMKAENKQSSKKHDTEIKLKYKQSERKKQLSQLHQQNTGNITHLFMSSKEGTKIRKASQNAQSDYNGAQR